VAQNVNAERAAARAEAASEQARIEKALGPLVAKRREADAKIESIIAAAEAKGFKVSNHGDHVVVRTTTRFDEEGYGYGYTSSIESAERTLIAELDRAELAVIEEILVAEFQSDEAKALLAKVPTIDALVESGTAPLLVVAGTAR
jgi:hypothetical protein